MQTATEKPWLFADIKVGDEVALVTGKYVSIHRVSKVTPSQFVAGNRHYKKISGRHAVAYSSLYVEEVTAKHRKAVAEQQAREAAYRAEEQKRQAIRNADPRTPYLDRLVGDWHPWDKLTLAQLQSVLKWLGQEL